MKIIYGKIKNKLTNIMNYKYFKVVAILESGNEIDFVLSGQDSNAIGLVVSKLPNIYKIKEIRLATEVEIPVDEK